MPSIQNTGLLNVYSQKSLTDAGISTTNLLGYWKLNSDATDSSGNGLTLSGTAPTYVTGLFSNAGDFETSSSQYLSVSASSLRVAGSQSFTAWVNVESWDASAQLRVMAVSDSGAANYVSLTTITSSGNKFSFQVSGLSAEVVSDNNYLTGVWYFLAGIYNSSTNKLTLWINDTKKEINITGTHTAGTGDFAIARLGSYTASTTYFDGIIDDVSMWGRALTDDEILTIYKTGGNCVGLWKLDGNGNDSSSFGYNLSGTAPTYVTGLYSQAGDFESTSSNYLEIANASCPNLQILDSRTISCWIKAESFTDYQKIVSKRNEGTGAAGYEIYTASGGIVGIVCAGLTTNDYVNHSDTLSTGVWYHVAGVYDKKNTKLKIFVNGVKVEVTASGFTANPTTPFVLGCNYNNGNTRQNYYDGVLEDVAIFNRALTDDEIISIYKTGVQFFTTLDF
jgi:hypothetical protein